MSNIYEKLVDHAEILVNIINKKYVAGNNMAYLALLSGVGNCRVESFAGAGHNYQAVVDAIHNYYRRDESSRADQGYQEGLYAMMRVASSFSVLQDLVHIIFYELKKEKEGTAGFTIDVDSTISGLNEVIEKNRVTYEKENTAFKEWLERNKQYALDNFSIEIG